MSAAQHTPRPEGSTPWEAEHRANYSNVLDAYGNAMVLGIGRKTAERIVQCVNAHDDLLAALRFLLEVDIDSENGKHRPDRKVAQANALQAIAKATGSTT